MNDTDIRLIYRQECNRIIHWVCSHSKGFRQNLALLGRPFVGKTFIISRVLDNLPEQVVSVLIDAKNVDKVYLMRSFSNSLISSYLRSQVDCSGLEEKLTYLKESLPATVDYISSHINRVVDFSGIFDLLNLFIKESGKRVLLIIEHFEHLESLWGREVFSHLANKIMEMKDVMFIITSSSLPRARAILRGELSLLFGNFEEIVLEPPVPIICKDYMRRVLPNLSSGVHKFIYRLTGGSPFYMDILCRRIRDLISDSREEWSVVKEVIYEQVFSEYGLIYQHFIRLISSLTDGPKGPQIGTFLLASSQEAKLESLSRRFGWQRHILEHKIDVLRAKGLLRVDHSSLFFEDYLFKFWLKNVYRLRMENAGIGEERFREIAIQLIDKEISSFWLQETVSAEEKIKELFKRFKDEFIIMPNGRRRRFYRFTHVEKINDCDYMYVVISPQRYKWVYGYREGWKESHAFEFISIAEKLGHSIRRKIMISLEPFPSPVKVIAKEENIWTWDQKVLNYLLSLHGIGEILW